MLVRELLPTKTKATKPFPGLRPFNPEEKNIFFGRDGLSDTLLDKLHENRLVAVVGTSGSGKSSLVRAGLLPTLRSGFTDTGSGWQVAMFRPTNNPIHYLAAALAKTGLFSSDSDTIEKTTKIIEKTLRRSSFGLLELVREARLPQYENLLIVADQFEELYRFEPSPEVERPKEEASAFVRLLLEATNQSELPIYVILTMRSDYLGDSAQFWGLPESINRGQFLIPRMDDDERREAIEGPIRVFDAKISPALVNRLLNDVGDDPRHLPILQHALMRTWDYWKANSSVSEPIGIEHYDNAKVGGMKASLSIHADEAYEDLGKEEKEGEENYGKQKKLAEKIFKRLTEKGVGKREGRTPATVGELAEIAAVSASEIIDVIEVFRAEGRSFLMPPPQKRLGPKSLIDISHESLISGWYRLNQWVEEEAESAKIYSRLEDDALGYPKNTNLLTNPELELALKWATTNAPNEAWAKRYQTDFGKALESDSPPKRPDWAEPSDSEFGIAIRYLNLSEGQFRQARRARRLKRQTVFAALAAASVLFFVLSALTANAARKFRQLKLEADVAKTQALTDRDAADRAKREAVTERGEADRQRERAVEAYNLAEIARQKADDNARQAVRLKAQAEEANRNAQSWATVGEATPKIFQAITAEDIKTAKAEFDKAKPAFNQKSISILPIMEVALANAIAESFDDEVDNEGALHYYKDVLELSTSNRLKIEPVVFAKIGSNIQASFLDDEEAIPYYKRAIELAKDTEDAKLKVETLLKLGALYNRTPAERASARRVYQQAADLAKQASNPLGQGDALTALGDTYFLERKDADAEGAYVKARDAYSVHENPAASAEMFAGHGRALEGLGKISERRGETATALEQYRAALEDYRKANSNIKLRGQMGRAIEDVRYRIRSLTPRISQVLQETIQTAGIEQAVKQYHDLKEKQPERYDFSESTMNSFGYVLLKDNKVTEAIEIFKLNVDAYPNSSNCFDSLADAYLKAGDKKLALKNYEEAVRLDPDNSIAAGKLRQLKETP